MFKEALHYMIALFITIYIYSDIFITIAFVINVMGQVTKEEIFRLSFIGATGVLVFQTQHPSSVGLRLQQS